MRLKDKEKPSRKDLEEDHSREQNFKMEEAGIVLEKRKANEARRQ